MGGIQIMNKIILNIIPSVNTVDIIEFITKNSENDWNTACGIFGSELNYIIHRHPEEIEMITEEEISKVIVSKLQYDGWIKNFTETQEITENYYILFTD